MSREHLHESLSAIMDGEADELELRRVLATGDGQELRQTWSRYQLARAAMHRELLLSNLDIAAAVSQRIELEDAPVLAAPAQTSTRWRSVGRVAVAASVTLAVLVGVRLYNSDELGGAQMAQQSVAPSLIAPNTQGLALLAGYSAEAPKAAVDEAADSENWHQQRLPAYLRQHAQNEAIGAGEGPLPYARASSLENR